MAKDNNIINKNLPYKLLGTAMNILIDEEGLLFGRSPGNFLADAF